MHDRLRLKPEIGKAGAAESRVENILVCAGSGCIASGSLDLIQALGESLEKQGLATETKVTATGCMGPCVVGPVCLMAPEGVFYQNVKPQDADAIVAEHVCGRGIVERLVHRAHGDGRPVPYMRDIGFFRKQVKIALHSCGLIDPCSIEDAIAHEAYLALSKALTSMDPQDVVNVVTDSGLRGRGGAGFPTGLKWSFASKARGREKYVVCNADEGDPGAFMDRSVLEGDPHSVIEAMAIAAYAIGASHGYVYVRAEYPLAVERLGLAIDQARGRGLLGSGILGENFSFDLEIRMGSGAFVCGEETALLTSIEGNRGEPRPRPPFPVNKGLWGRPTLLNNVETFASIPPIIIKGAEWYAGHGTEKSKGTKVFALAGAVRNTGLVEIPIGAPLGDIIFDIGGGIPGGKKLKAVQMGGPSGGCIPKQHLNVPVDYESLTGLGAIMGSGGMIVMDEDACMVDMARFFLEFTQDESCGKCPPCRVGTKRMLEIVTGICDGEGREGDVEKLIYLGEKIKDTALCGLGQTAPNPLLSTIRYFRDEYDAHIREKRCPAGACQALVPSPCQNACPAGVDVPGFVALVGEKRYDEALRLHRERNPFAAVCAHVCFHPCESKCRRAETDSPLNIRYLKRFMIEQEGEACLPEVRENKANAGRKIAILGAGPAGLSCAYFLARLGYRPEVLEAQGVPGGMLVQGIPEYRLPRRLLAGEIEMIKKMGVFIRTGARLGRDFTLQKLREEGCEAVFLAIGAPGPVRLDIPGADAEGVVDALWYLRNNNLGDNAKTGRKVVVIGGGNAAIDAARTAWRLGAGEVTVVYRRTRGEMPAWKEEVDEAQKEGVRFEFLASPLEVMRSNGGVSALKCARMKPGPFDESGRRRPVPLNGGKLVIETDQVIVAIGQVVEPDDLLRGTDLDMGKGGFIKADPETCRTGIDWIFAGGDAATGPASVAAAVGCGEKAAVSIDTLLTGESHAFWRAARGVLAAFDPDADPVDTPRTAVETLPVEQRRGNFNEVELPWDEKTALAEAKRCLRCDYREET